MIKQDEGEELEACMLRVIHLQYMRTRCLAQSRIKGLRQQTWNWLARWVDSALSDALKSEDECIERVFSRARSRQRSERRLDD